MDITDEKSTPNYPKTNQLTRTNNKEKVKRKQKPSDQSKTTNGQNYPSPIKNHENHQQSQDKSPGGS
jgi:hypothetical protein